jgi:predicted PolB exonuclease-like 3'-5' exonuclease
MYACTYICMSTYKYIPKKTSHSQHSISQHIHNITTAYARHIKPETAAITITATTYIHVCNINYYFQQHHFKNIFGPINSILILTHKQSILSQL